MTDTTPLNFLIVDDANFIRDLVRKAVAEVYSTCSIVEASDGKQAVTQMQNSSINVVLCDWEMPEVSGLEVLQWMRADSRYQKVPFMMITSRGERDHVIKAVQAGVSEYIGKPFTKEKFIEKLSKLVWKFHKVRADTGVSAQSDILTTAGKVPKQKPSQDLGGASVLMGGTNAARGAKIGNTAGTKSVKPGGKTPGRTLGQATVRLGSGAEFSVDIKDINLQEMLGVFQRAQEIPALLDQIVVDINDDVSGDVARINAYVRMLQAQETHADASTIQMLIRYVDDDPKKLETLSRYIAKVR